MRVIICGRHHPEAYSGGRYHAWMMGEALAAAGHDIVVWTNHDPLLKQDFVDFPAHERVSLHLDGAFKQPPAGPFDVMIVVPHTGPLWHMYTNAIAAARDARARLVLLNFESGNWFNAYAPEPRELWHWDGWKLVARYGDMVLSSAAESTRWARDFYTLPAASLFRHCYPAINSFAADDVPTPATRERRIVCLTRFVPGNRHKGAADIERALCPAMHGYEMVLLIGHGQADQAALAPLRQRAEAMGITLRLVHRLTDREKFALIKSASLMLFLSYFEGFGYPPIEAQYCNVPCVAYDLPVLREVSGDALRYVPPGDGAALRTAVAAALAEPTPTELSQRIAPVARFERYRDRMDALVREVTALTSPPASIKARDAVLADWLEARRPAAPPQPTRVRALAGRVYRKAGRVLKAWGRSFRQTVEDSR